VVLNLVEQRERLFEILCRFAGESDDHVGSDADGTRGGLHPGNPLKVFLARVLTLHQLKDAGGATLNRKMNVIAEDWIGLDHVNDVAGEVAGMRRCKRTRFTPEILPTQSNNSAKLILPEGSR